MTSGARRGFVGRRTSEALQGELEVAQTLLAGDVRLSRMEDAVHEMLQFEAQRLDSADQKLARHVAPVGPVVAVLADLARHEVRNEIAVFRRGLDGAHPEGS